MSTFIEITMLLEILMFTVQPWYTLVLLLALVMTQIIVCVVSVELYLTATQSQRKEEAKDDC